eukprot:768685-Hanusia_phi.AAC.2
MDICEWRSCSRNLTSRSGRRRRADIELRLDSCHHVTVRCSFQAVDRLSPRCRASAWRQGGARKERRVSTEGIGYPSGSSRRWSG